MAFNFKKFQSTIQAGGSVLTNSEDGDSPTIKPTEFVKGPISLLWISKAARLPGRTFHTALALWHIHCLKKSASIKMQSRFRQIFGISEESYSKSLKRLEEAGLVTIKRRPGQTPSVTLILPENSLRNQGLIQKL